MSVHNINPDTEAFRKSLDLLKRHQTLPILAMTLKKAINAQASISIVSESLKDIFVCDDDQFWGTAESDYWCNNRLDLEPYKKDLEQYGTVNEGVKTWLEILWDVILAFGISNISESYFF